jgi:regulator of cell morphogenesis and NO signaling
MPENSAFFPQVMQRYTNYDPLAGVDQTFIAALLRAFDEKPFCAEDFDRFPIEMIIEYIKRTHVFYLKKKLPEIEQNIILLSGLYTSHHPILNALQDFFKAYCQDLTAHIMAEETLLLPHIALLCRSIHPAGHHSEYIFARELYTIAGFLAAHNDTEDELRDIRRTIRLYEPPSTNASLYRILLTQLEAFERDLSVHAHIEDQVLIPKALQMETALNERLGKIAEAN